MNGWRGEEVVGVVVSLRFVLGLMLVFAGVEKLRDIQGFVAGVLQYKILPVGLAGWYGRLLPVVELGTGVFLILGVWSVPVATLSAAMFASFAIAVAINLLRK